jgi:hypothetical protein
MSGSTGGQGGNSISILNSTNICFGGDGNGSATLNNQYGSGGEGGDNGGSGNGGSGASGVVYLRWLT